MGTQIIICLGTDFKGKLKRVEQLLPRYLSKKYDVLCFEYPRFRNLMRLIARGSLTERINPDLTVFHSPGLPNGRNYPLINSFNHRFNFLLLKFFFGFKGKKQILISFTPEAVHLADLHRGFGNVIYYVIDNYIALPFWKNPHASKLFSVLEKRFLGRVNRIIAVSKTLKSKYENLHKNVSYFPTPFTPVAVRDALNIKPPELKELKGPVIGFLGELDDWRIETRLLLKNMRTYPDFNFVQLGLYSIRNGKLDKEFRNLSNFTRLGYKKDSEVGNYLKHFTVGIIPYKTDAYGKYAFPVKINEYFQFGIPVVTTSLPAISDLSGGGLVYLSEKGTDFIKNIYRAVYENDKGLKIERIRYARGNTWPNRMGKLISIIGNE